MTTILLEKSGFPSLLLYAGKVEESGEKDLAQYARPIPPSKQGADQISEDQPKRNALDFLNFKRSFELAGYFDKDSVTGVSTAQDARDVFVNMVRAGGSLVFRYGVPADVEGSWYSPQTKNFYYNQGFTVHVLKYKVKEEDAKGGTEEYNSSDAAAQHLPEQYHFNLELVKARDQG